MASQSTPATHMMREFTLRGVLLGGLITLLFTPPTSISASGSASPSRPRFPSRWRVRPAARPGRMPG